jgi:hypothetical protein
MRTAFLAVCCIVCIWSILYWAVKRTPSGGWALLAPSGLSWVIELSCVLLVWIRHMSLLHLLWLMPAALIAYLVIAKILYSTGIYRSGV